jgi:hypothetical protein
MDRIPKSALSAVKSSSFLFAPFALPPIIGFAVKTPCKFVKFVSRPVDSARDHSQQFQFQLRGTRQHR